MRLVTGVLVFAIGVLTVRLIVVLPACVTPATFVGEGRTFCATVR